MSSTRVFFVTDSTEDNEELHETLEQAQAYKLSGLSEPTTGRIRICLVRNYYKEEKPDGSFGWNYDDLADTFNTVKEL